MTSSLGAASGWVSLVESFSKSRGVGGVIIGVSLFLVLSRLNTAPTKTKKKDENIAKKLLLLKKKPKWKNI